MLLYRAVALTAANSPIPSRAARLGEHTAIERASLKMKQAVMGSPLSVCSQETPVPFPWHFSANVDNGCEEPTGLLKHPSELFPQTRQRRCLLLLHPSWLTHRAPTVITLFVQLLPCLLQPPPARKSKCISHACEHPVRVIYYTEDHKQYLKTAFVAGWQCT